MLDAPDPKKVAWHRRAVRLALLLGALALPALTAESGEMNRSDIDNLVAGLFAADAGGEYQAAMDIVTATEAAGTPASAILTAINRAGRLSPSDHAASTDRVVVITVGDEVYVWRPKDDASVAAFFLE